MATEFDISHSAATIYAESLLELAHQAGQEKAVGEELAQLDELWRKNREFADLMRSQAIDDDARAESIRRIFSGRVSPLVLHLLLVLNQRRRSMVLPFVCRAYQERLDARLNREEAFITTAAPLSDPQREALKAQLQRLMKKEPILVERVDPRLLGGMRVQVADKLFDATVRRRLQDLRRALHESIEQNLRGGIGRFVKES